MNELERLEKAVADAEDDMKTAYDDAYDACESAYYAWFKVEQKLAWFKAELTPSNHLKEQDSD